MHVRRRDFLKVVVAASAGSLALAPRPSRAEPGVKIGSAVLGAYMLSGPIVVAVEKGFFKGQGLNAEFVPFRGGPDLVKAVVGGDVLLGLTGSTDIVLFREAGLPIKMVATQGEGNDFVLLTAPDGPRLGDLKGKAIGVTREGSATWIFARMAAKAQHWDPDHDVKVVALGGLDAQLAALSRKEIAAFVWGDFGAVTGAQGRTKVALRMDTLTPKWVSYIQYASEAQIARNPDAIRRSMRALFQALHFMKTSPDESSRIVAAKLGWTPEAVAAVHRACAAIMPDDGRIDPAAIKAMQETLLEYGSIKKRVPLEDHYTTAFTPVRV